MGEFTKPVEDLGRSAKDYVDLKVEDVKLRLVKGLSFSLGKLLSMILVLFLCSVVLFALAIGLILLIGQAMDNYAAGAFIVAGGFALVGIIVYLLRKKLFVSSFVGMMEDLGKVSSLGELEKKQEDVRDSLIRKEEEISYRISGLKETYSPLNMFMSGLRRTGGDTLILTIIQRIRDYLNRQ